MYFKQRMNYLLLIYWIRGIKSFDNVKKIDMWGGLSKTSEVSQEIYLDQNLGGSIILKSNFDQA
jgi:hypothetical protein